MAWRLLGAKPLPEPMLTYCHLSPQEQTSVEFVSKYIFHWWKCIWQCRLRNVGHFVQGGYVNGILVTPCSNPCIYEFTWKHDYIFYDFLILGLWRQWESSRWKNNYPLILHSQCHGCLWTGDEGATQLQSRFWPGSLRIFGFQYHEC